MKHRKYKMFFAGVVSVTMILTTGCGLLPMKQENRVAPIAQTIEQQQFVFVDVEQGNVTSTETVVLSANFGESNVLSFNKPAAVVETVYFKPGDTVKEGDLLIEANTSEHLEQISRLETNISEYSANIDYYTELIEIEKERIRIYNSIGTEYDDSMLNQYQNQLTYNEDALGVAYRQLAEAQSDYENSRIYAPYNGTVTYIAEVSDLLYEKQMAVKLIRENVYYYATTDKEEYFEVGKTYTAEYRYYKAAPAESYDLDEIESMYGEVDESFWEVQLVTDNVDLECKEINLLNEATGVYEILFGYNSVLSEVDVISTRISFVTDSAENVLYVPKNTVINTSNGYAVYMLSDDGSRTIKDVEVGVKGDNYYEIKSGLSLGDQVISDKTRVDEDLQNELYRD